MLYLAITKAGGLSTPVPMQWRPEELKYVATITESKALITIEESGALAIENWLSA